MDHLLDAFSYEFIKNFIEDLQFYLVTDILYLGVPITDLQWDKIQVCWFFLYFNFNTDLKGSQKTRPTKENHPRIVADPLCPEGNLSSVWVKPKISPTKYPSKYL